MLIISIIYILLTVLNAKWDALKYANGSYTDEHAGRATIWAVFCIVASALDYLIKGEEGYEIASIIYYAIAMTLTRTAIFDYALNLLRTELRLPFWKRLIYDSLQTSSEIDQKIKFNKNWIRVAAIVLYILFNIFYNQILTIK